MRYDPIRGKTIQWTFIDGPMANRTFEHVFKDDGSLTFRSVDGEGSAKSTVVKKYEVAAVGPDVYAASYLGPSGYALTVVLDYRTGHVVAFASNEKGLVLQHGTFHEVEAAKKGARAIDSGEHTPHPPRT